MSITLHKLSIEIKQQFSHYNLMKRFINGLAALAAAAVIALPACSGSKVEKEAEKAAETPETTIAAQEVHDAVTELPAGTPGFQNYQGKLLVVDFNAVWCGPCRKYGPIFHAVAEKMADRATFISVNVDSCPDIAKEYVGQFIPQTTVIRADGQKYDKVGELTEEQLTAFIDSVAAL